MRVRQFVMLLMVLALAVPAVAQEQRGAIEGVVKDSSGGVLPGVTVEAKSAAGAVDDRRDRFQGRLPVPGRRSRQVHRDRHADRLQAGARREPRSAARPDQDAWTSRCRIGGCHRGSAWSPRKRRSWTCGRARAPRASRAEQIDLLPKGRDFTSLVTQAPGANSETKSNGVMIDGATTSENRYIVDGAETSDIVSGGSGKALLPDFIEEVQVKSSGYTAEYGGAMGGVINVITKSGTNNWRGNALF